MPGMRRREFITLLGGAAAWPLAARAQPPSLRVIGVLGIGSPESNAKQLASFRNGLSEQGFAEGQNAVIESRFAATGQYDGLLSLAFDLVRLPVTVLAAIGTAGVARAAKTATTTIPIAFANGSDPVKVGLVASMNWPGGNATGVSFYTSTLGPKRLELLRELVPQATTIAFLVNPTNPVTEGDTKDMEDAARNIGQRMHCGSRQERERNRHGIRHRCSGTGRLSPRQCRRILQHPVAISLPRLQHTIGFPPATIIGCTSRPAG